jgi:hypothetical protein
MAKEKKAKKEKGKGKKSSTKLVVGMIIGSIAMIVLLKMTYLLFIVGMLPTFVAFYIDRTPSHYIFHTVMPCNLSGVLPFVVELAALGNHTSAMQQMIGDLSVLLIMYVSAGFGWILVYTSPHVASMVINGLNIRQVNRVKHTQISLEREWGTELKQAATES